MTNSPKAGHLAEHILIDIARSADLELPSVHALARKYGAGKNTISKALHMLAEKGVIEITSGGKGTARVLRESERLAFEPGGISSAAQALFEKLRAVILSGEIRVGVLLPKHGFLAEQEHISRQNIGDAFRLLCNEKLAHKKGKQWIAGPAATESPGLVPREEIPVVVVVCPNFAYWRHYWLNIYGIYNAFCREFSEELERARIEISLAYMEESVEEPGRPHGEAAVTDYLLSLGRRHAGTLFLTNNKIAPGTWVKTLMRFYKPTVWLEAGKRELEYSEAAAKDGNEILAYCQYEERSAVALAVETLVKRGHTRIGVPRLDNTRNNGFFDWSAHRVSLVQECVRGCSPRPEIHVIDMKDDCWYDTTWRTQEERFAELIQARIDGAPRSRDIVSTAEIARTFFPEIINAIASKSLSALIAPNDLYARLLACWLGRCGYRIPRDISLVGFDNDLSSYQFPISTVDFGIRRMGYHAAHYIIGDIPVKLGRKRTLRAQPRLVERGSIGEAQALGH